MPAVSNFVDFPLDSHAVSNIVRDAALIVWRDNRASSEYLQNISDEIRASNCIAVYVNNELCVINDDVVQNNWTMLFALAVRIVHDDNDIKRVYDENMELRNKLSSIYNQINTLIRTFGKRS